MARKSPEMATFDLTQEALEDLLMVVGEGRHQAHLTCELVRQVRIEREHAEHHLRAIAAREIALAKLVQEQLEILGHEQHQASRLCKQLGFPHLREDLQARIPAMAEPGALSAAVEEVARRNHVHDEEVAQ